MIKKIKIEEVYRFQKIAGLLKEEDLDLSDTPEFRGMPSATELIDAFNDFDNEVNIGATYRKPAYRTLKHVTDDNSAPEEAAFGEESFSLFNLNSRNYVVGYKDYIYKGMRFKGGVTIEDFLSNFLEKGIIFELGGAYWYYKYDLSLFLKELKSWCNQFCDKEFYIEYSSQDQDYYFVEGKNDIDLSDTPEFFSEPDMWDEGFRSFAWDIVGDHYEELYGTIDLDDIDDVIGQYLMNLPYDKLKALWGDYTKHKRTGLKESSIDLSDTPEFRSLGRSKIQREFEKAGVNVKRPIFVYSAYRLIGSYGIEERSVGEYIDDILNTIDDLESDPDYGDSYGDVELKIVSNPDDINPFDYFVEDDPKDIKLKVLIEGAVHDLIFQK